ncbi:GDSL-type esterase/lipase family protein [Mangrovibacterium lignilyticum]|uniref:GDSL-type esterase/lipase family protein n=1 Tax=Mangrovibacterium lignilyticum TaxID=2668052 RepID=UPI0013D0E2B9|nr:GDSL-type esterase/lipase family protein [Mangrovibacterium lignilyticum]
MKPVRAFLFLVSVLSLLFLVSFYRLKRSQEQLHVPISQAPIEALLNDEDSIPEFQELDSIAHSDSLLLLSDVLEADSVKAEIISFDDLIFAPTDSVRFTALTERLHSLPGTKQQVRIFYYGDSQIEGDHITSALRKSFQARYGGKGPGLIAPDQYYNPPHQLIMTLSDNWQNLTIKEMRGENRSIVFRNALTVSGDEPAWFRINRLRFLDPQADYNQLRFFLYCSDNSRVELSNSAQPVFQTQIDTIDQVQEFKMSFNETPDDLKLSFSTNDSLWVTGLSLESETGVFVDNIALRGLSYPPFSSSDRASLKQMSDKLQPSLFILHFGVNVVPYFSENYKAFRYQLNRQINLIRQLRPDASILIIGVSDMAHRVEGEFVSYENINQIKQIQLELAMKNGCAFWDLENYMGGPGSMIRWVNTEPPLGRKDYIHFSAAGAEQVGRELARILINEIEYSQLTAWKNN